MLDLGAVVRLGGVTPTGTPQLLPTWNVRTKDGDEFLAPQNTVLSWGDGMGMFIFSLCVFIRFLFASMVNLYGVLGAVGTKVLAREKEVVCKE